MRITFTGDADFVAQVSRAARRVFRSLGYPPDPAAELVVAHAALSCGYGRRHLYNWNLFGIKAGRSWSGGTFTTGTYEYKDGVRYYVPKATWRSYASPDECIRDYVVILSFSRYRLAKAALLEGRYDVGPGGYMWELGEHGEGKTATGGWYTNLPDVVAADYAEHFIPPVHRLMTPAGDFGAVALGVLGMLAAVALALWGFGVFG